MTKYLSGVLTVIAAGVLLIAYGLLAPQAQASLAPTPGLAHVVPSPWVAGAAAVPQAPASVPLSAPVAAVPARAAVSIPAVQVIDEAPPSARTVVRDEPRRVSTRTVVEPRRRDWKKAAMVIGGSSAAGAGIGALVGGRKGALIGAAIGGGAGTVYETRRR